MILGVRTRCGAVERCTYSCPETAGVASLSLTRKCVLKPPNAKKTGRPAFPPPPPTHAFFKNVRPGSGQPSSRPGLCLHIRVCVCVRVPSFLAGNAPGTRAMARTAGTGSVPSLRSCCKRCAWTPTFSRYVDSVTVLPPPERWKAGLQKSRREDMNVPSWQIDAVHICRGKASPPLLTSSDFGSHKKGAFLCRLTLVASDAPDSMLCGLYCPLVRAFAARSVLAVPTTSLSKCFAVFFGAYLILFAPPH